MAPPPVPSSTHAVSSPGTTPSCSVSICHADELTVIAESAKKAFIAPVVPPAAGARRRGAAPLPKEACSTSDSSTLARFLRIERIACHCRCRAASHSAEP